MNFGVSLSLPIYSTQSMKEQKARANELGAKKQKEDTLIAINATLEAYYMQMRWANETYKILQNRALPQTAHMFELSSSSISIGGELFKYMEILFLKLSLEQKSISAIATYRKAQAKISQLAGATL